MITTQTTQSIQLRDYQQTLIRATYESWTRHPSVMLQLPTGGGKTLILAAIARDFVQRGESVLVCAHRSELIEQAASKLQSICQSEVGIIKHRVKPNPKALIQVASVQSLVHRLDQIAKPALFVVDEAHHCAASTYREILKACKGAYILGCSATPCRTDGRGFSDLFGEMVCGPTIGELIDAGHLSKFKLFGVPNPMATGRLIRGDFLMSDVAKRNDEVKLSGDLVRSYKQHADGMSCVVFCVNVSHSEAIAQRYNQSGIPALHLDGGSDPDFRKEALKRFAAGEIKVLTNCDLFGEGLDIPGIAAVQIAKPTVSLARWLQMLGRALRPAPGKDYAVLLDHTDNWQRLGLPTRPRTWSLEGVEQERQRCERSRETGEVQVREIVEEVDIDLKAIEDDFDRAIAGFYQASSPKLSEEDLLWQELLQKQRRRGYQPQWLYWQLKEMKAPLALWQKYGAWRGYAPGWAWHQWRAVEQ